ncbi:MAG TPA: Ig-like domain repeat protein, partial [Candidatus Binatia bacterium]|nr:Ig-like domain repeat protein [Candidatus Binatia bacterium]
SNGNFRSVGTATTDSQGMYTLTWTPDIPGDFKVIATFAGTNGYWPSNSEASFTVSEAHPTTAPTAPPNQLVSEQYFIPAVVGIIVAIAIVGAVLALLMLRKRP